MLDEVARHKARRPSRPRSMSARRRSIPACRASAPRTIWASAIATAGEHLDRQSDAHRRSSRPAGQHRLRGRRPSPLHAVPTRAAAEPLHRSAGFHARGPSHQPGRFRAAGPARRFRSSPRPCAMRRWPNSGRATRSSFPACGGITSRRSTASMCWSTTGGASRPRYMDSPINALMLAIMTRARSAESAARCLAELVSPLRVRGGREHRQPHSGSRPAACWRRSTPKRCASCARGCCKD